MRDPSATNTIFTGEKGKRSWPCCYITVQFGFKVLLFARLKLRILQVLISPDFLRCSCL